MTREEFKIIVKGMKAVYANDRFIPDQDAFNVWYEYLKDLDYRTLSNAVHQHITTSDYPPTISALRRNAIPVREMGEAQAWALVRKGIQNGIYGAEKEFDEMPRTVQRAVGDPANLREWAMMPSNDVESVIQSHFLRSYRNACEQEKQRAMLPPGIGMLDMARIGG